jgi:cell division protein FtsL
VGWEQVITIVVTVVLAVLVAVLYNNRRFDDVNRRFDDVNRRFDDVHRRMDDLRSDMNARFAQVREVRALLQEALRTRTS